jgi:hypothetical protein
MASPWLLDKSRATCIHNTWMYIIQTFEIFMYVSSKLARCVIHVHRQQHLVRDSCRNLPLYGASPGNSLRKRMLRTQLLGNLHPLPYACSSAYKAQFAGLSGLARILLFWRTGLLLSARFFATLIIQNRASMVALHTWIRQRKKAYKKSLCVLYNGLPLTRLTEDNPNDHY